MSKTYEVHSMGDLMVMANKIADYQQKRINDGQSFQSLNIICKRYRKPKSSSQHKAYWRCIGEIKKAMAEVGTLLNEDEIHEFVKYKSGFTKSVELPDGKHVTITKSIADNSDDVNGESINFLISWMQEWSRDFLNYEIKIGEYI